MDHWTPLYPMATRMSWATNKLTVLTSSPLGDVRQYTNEERVVGVRPWPDLDHSCQKVPTNQINNLVVKKRLLIFYFPDRESIVIVKKNDVEILTNLYVLRSQESEKVFFKKCRVYSVLCDGHWRQKYSTSGMEMKLWRWDKTRTEMRFFGVLCNKRSNGG